MGKALPIQYYENLHNKKYPNNLIKVLYKKGIIIYFETSFGLCKKQYGTFGTNNYTIRSAVNRENYLKLQFKSLFGNKYGYEDLNYDSKTKKVEILCYKHGIFKQDFRAHIKGQGCPICNQENRNKMNSQNSTGWSKLDWIKAANQSKNFDSFKVYIIRCWNDEEEFYKIGRTFFKIEIRFRGKRKMPYKYEIIRLFEGSADYIYTLELKLKQLNKNNMYKPRIHFNGNLECYTKVKYLNK
jgi:hypothetical protein